LTEAYRGKRVAFLTQHGKEHVLAPVLEPPLGCTIERVDGFDTDQLGTFTRDRTRSGSQIDAARRKARIGMELSGLSVGMASEGSFGPDPFTGLLTWNVELLVWIDDELGIEVVGVAQGAATVGHLLTDDPRAAIEFAHRQGFPDQRLVLRPSGQDDPRVRKGIADWASLESGIDRCRAAAGNGMVFIEADLRAFACPARRERIAEAGGKLLAHLRSACPSCGLPGYVVTGRESGLRCSCCGLPTQVWRAERWRCQGCCFEAVVERYDRQHADPGECLYCNP
jgi:hypothetical protein